MLGHDVKNIRSSALLLQSAFEVFQLKAHNNPTCGRIIFGVEKRQSMTF